MIRFATATVAALLLTAAPVGAQTTPPQTPGKTAAAISDPTPGSEEWLRLRGERNLEASDDVASGDVPVHD